MSAHWSEEESRLRTIHALRERIAEKLEGVRALYKDDVKLTLIARVPGHVGRDTVLTDDDPKLAVAALEALFKDPKSEVHSSDPTPDAPTKTYPCGCSASGAAGIPDYCPEHGQKPCT